MFVSRDNIDVVADLSRLSLNEDEATAVEGQLDRFLSYVDNLKAVDTTDVDPTTYPLPMKNVFREDVVLPSLDRAAALSNAPLQEGGFFKVPRVLEG